MKKILLLCFLFLFTALHADQLEWISLEQAKKATEFLKTQKEVIEYRACNDVPTYKTLKIKQVEYRYTGTKDYYQVYVLGKNQEENNEEWATDLAYLYFNEKGIAQNVGKYLKFECDPCTAPFDWAKNPLISDEPQEVTFVGIWQNYPNQTKDSHLIKLNLEEGDGGAIKGSLSTKNAKTKKEYTYIVEGMVSNKGVARLEVIERNKKGSFSIAWIEVSLQGYGFLHWEKESGDNVIFPNAINLTTETN